MVGRISVPEWECGHIKLFSQRYMNRFASDTIRTPKLVTMAWRKEGLNGLLQAASAKLPIMDRAAKPLRIGLGGCRRCLLVARIQGNSENMHASVLLLPILAGVTGDTELLADELF